MLFVPLSDDAHVMVCDEVCLKAVDDRLPTFAPVDYVEAWPTCVTCFHCGLTIPGAQCPCDRLGVSCSAPSWLLTYHPHAALDAIFDICGPVLFTDDDWLRLTALGEQVTSGGLAGVLWVREQHPAGEQ
jgi:hypothetical protein